MVKQSYKVPYLMKHFKVNISLKWVYKCPLSSFIYYPTKKNTKNGFCLSKTS